MNYSEIGLGIKKALNEKICKREDLFIITKFYVQSRNNPELSLKKSLNHLQIEYVDLFLDHWPVFYNYGIIMKKSINVHYMLSEIKWKNVLKKN